MADLFKKQALGNVEGRQSVFLTALAILWWFPAAVLAGGGKPALPLINVIDTRNLAPGFVKFVADLYNDDLLLSGLLVVLVMTTMGAVLGFAFDRVIGLLGINLGKLDHHE